MGTQGVGTFQINSKFSSGNLIFYEKTVGRTVTGDVFTVGTAAVKVGGTGNDIDLQYYGTGSLSAIIDCGAATFTLVGITSATDKPISITDATASTTTATGALKVTGGVGIAKGLFVGEVVSVGTVCQPDAADGAALGTGTLMWSDLFLASGGVINFNNGDVTLTHAANLLTLGGGELAVATGFSLLVGGTDDGAATNTVTILSGTAPAAGVADTVQIYSSDIAAGHTEPSFYCEGTSVLATAQADSVSSVRVKMRINGTEVTLLAI